MTKCADVLFGMKAASNVQALSQARKRRHKDGGQRHAHYVGWAYTYADGSMFDPDNIRATPPIS